MWGESLAHSGGEDVNSTKEQRGIPFTNTTDAEPWRHPEFAVRTAAGPIGFDVPTLVLGSTVKGFCPKLLPLPHFVVGVILIFAAAVADRRLRARG